MQEQKQPRAFFFYSLSALLLIILILGMYQIDRHWKKLAQMQSIVSEQAQDIRDIRASMGNVHTSMSNVQNSMSNVQQAVANLEHRLSSTQTVISPLVSAHPKATETPANTITTTKVTEDSAKQALNAKGFAFDRALAASQNEDYAQGDWRVSAFGTSLSTISPLVSTDAYSSDVQSYVLEALLTRDPDSLEWKGLLAKDWQISDDGLVITYQLRDNVTFSDGEAFDASDVVFTFDFIMTEAIQAPRERAYLDKIESVKANNAYEVVFTLKEPYFRSLSLTGGMQILAEHFYKPYLETPQIFNESKGLLLGSGPYRLQDPKTWTPDQGGVELVRNNRYWGNVQPSFERMVWRIIANDSARLTTYRNGDIDSYNARPIEYKDLLEDEALMAKSQNFEYMSPTGGYSYIGWNQEKDGQVTRFADKRVRQAMTWLSNRQRIIEEIFLGYGEVAISPFYSKSKQHAPDLKARAYDLDKAKQLLAEAGYKDNDGNGVLEDAQGQPFEFELTYFQDNEDTKRMVLLLKDIYARAGIVLKPKPSEWPVMLEELEKKTFDAITLGWTGGLEGDIYQMFHSSQSKTNGDNFISYNSKALDEIIEKARSTVIEEKRMPLWQEAERIIYEDQPYTFLVRRMSLNFIDQRIRNLQMTNSGLNDVLPIEWYVPKSVQKYTQ